MAAISTTTTAAGTMHHAKSDSEVTMSYDQSTPPRSPRRPLYYVQSPSNHDAADKMSYGSSPAGSPPHHHHHHQNHYYHCSPIHHSRESSATRFSASLKNPRSHNLNINNSWKKIVNNRNSGDDSDSEDGDSDSDFLNAKLYVLFFIIGFVALFSLFSLVLWAASKSSYPRVSVQDIEFRRFNIQAGNDRTGVPTDMMSLNSTVRILYKNPATFFGVHVSSSPFELRYHQLKVASGQMRNFFQERKSHRTILTTVLSHQVPLYGGVSVARAIKDNPDSVVIPLNLTFVVRSRAYILGHLVKSKFYRRVKCSVTLKGNKLGKAFNLTDSCTYH